MQYGWRVSKRSISPTFFSSHFRLRLAGVLHALHDLPLLFIIFRCMRWMAVFSAAFDVYENSCKLVRATIASIYIFKKEVKISIFKVLIEIALYAFAIILKHLFWIACNLHAISLRCSGNFIEVYHALQP
jgi:hypothetical protein